MQNNGLMLVFEEYYNFDYSGHVLNYGGKTMDGLELYKAFIDGLVSKKDGVYRKWIIEKGYPQTDDNKDINELLGVLSNEQKNVLAKIVCEARNSGIHDTLAYMNELMECDGLEISQNGEVFPYDEYDSMHYDFICRCEGDDWPE